MIERSDTDHAVARRVSVQAAMFFPDDEGKRASYVDAYFGKAAQTLLDKKSHETLNADEAISLFDLARGSPAFDGLCAAALRTVRRNQLVHTRGALPADHKPPALAGSVAANALGIPLICNLKYKTNNVGLHQSFRIILGADRTDDPTGLRNLQNIWKHYKPVAHFWTACQLLHFKIGNSLQDVTEFISLADTIRVWGEQYRPIRSATPLLEGSTTAKVPAEWVVPCLINIDDLDLSDEAKGMLFN